MAEEFKRAEKKSLRRVLGLPAALTIGLGTMLGAGIFVFPGLAGGRAGIGGAVSFGLAGSVAFIVALCMAELSTAIPRSGGAYYFISRGLGALWGSLTGTSVWLGLIFATGFYLVAFGRYMVDLLVRLGVAADGSCDISLLTGISAAVLLTGINIVGAGKAGKIQKYTVILLVVIVTGFLAVGLLKTTGLMDGSTVSRELPDRPLSSILGATALIFTSYLGFAQISNVSGEIKKPHRNLPLALGGSVIIATVLYVLTMVVITGEFTIDEMSRMGETAMLRLGRSLFGGKGTILLTLAGLLATISSANASILSSSRILFALGKDRMVPEWTTRVSKKYSVPYASVVMTCVPVVLTMFLCDIKLLAQIASILHLLMYTLICVSLVVLRRIRPKYYSPSFKLPFYRPFAAAGALGCFAIVLFMDRTAQIASAVLIFTSLIWYLVYASGRQTRRSRKK